MFMDYIIYNGATEVIAEQTMLQDLERLFRKSNSLLDKFVSPIPDGVPTELAEGEQANEQTSERVSERANERASERANKRANEQRSERTSKQTNKQMNKRTNKQANEDREIGA